MDTALPHKFTFILDRNLAKANCTGNHVRTSCDTVVLGKYSSQVELLLLLLLKRYFKGFIPAVLILFGLEASVIKRFI